jgi:hypothetical protein
MIYAKEVYQPRNPGDGVNACGIQNRIALVRLNGRRVTSAIKHLKISKESK